MSTARGDHREQAVGGPAQVRSGRDSGMSGARWERFSVGPCSSWQGRNGTTVV